MCVYIVYIHIYIYIYIYIHIFHQKAPNVPLP